MEYHYRISGQTHTVRVTREGDAYRISVNGAEPYDVRVTRPAEGVIEISGARGRTRLHVVGRGERRYIAIGSQVFELQKIERQSARRDTGASAGGLEAAMPGLVIAVAVSAGDEVAYGQTLVILEAMKMELRVQAPYAGRVERVLVAVGQVVERGQRLVELAEMNS